ATAPDAGLRIPQFAPLSFDIIFQETFTALCAGGTLVLLTEDDRRDPLLLVERIEQHRIERLYLPFVALQQLCEVAAERPPQPLREVITAGEQLQVSRKVERFFTGSGCTLENQYGPSEAHVVTYYPLPGEPARWPPLPPVGRGLGNFRIYILSSQLDPVPPGMPGEVCITGPGLARGYLKRPELTAAAFIPDPFNEEAGARLYRTGDLARFLADGNVEFMGRIDLQVKIRGFRIELGEIETVLGWHPEVREAVVVVREDAGNRRLVAYVVRADEAAVLDAVALDAGELRSFLGESLPDYMVPPVVVFLDALPWTPGGKIDRKALPAPEPGALRAAEELAAPRDPIEEILAGIWMQVLDLKELGVHDDFFALGGHSLLATQVVSRIRAELRVELPLRLLFEEPTVAGFATCVAAALRREEGLEAPPIRPLVHEDHSPLSFAQQRLWFIDRFEPDSALYNLPSIVHLHGRLDRRSLACALVEIVRRHQVLRTVFETVDGEPVQVIQPPFELPLPLCDLGALGEEDRQAEAYRLAVADARRPFDLARGPMLRAALLHLVGAPESEQHVLLLNVHHIAFDGWSLGVFLRELRALYQAFSLGQSSPLPELGVQYADFAVWQRQWLRGEVLEKQLDYWRRQLVGLPVLELPCDRPRPAVQSFRGALEPFQLRPELGARLEQLSRARGGTLFMTLLAAFQLLLGRYAGRQDLAVGSVVANRNRAEIEPLVGFFVNTLVLRGDLRGDPAFVELLARAREVALGAYAHQDLPFEKLVEELEPERDLSQSPLVQVLFALQNAPMTIPELAPGLKVTIGGVATEVAKFDLTLGLIEDPGGLGGAVEYNTELFDATTIRRLVGHLEHLLEGAVAGPEKRLSELPWLAAAEARQLLVEWNDTASDYPGELSIARLFELRAEQLPEAVAVVFGDELLTYAELNRRANRLAYYLPARVAGAPELMVALLMERSLRTVVAILAILKAGGVYVPLDLSYPPERLAFMLEDAEAPVLITEEAVAVSLPA
ncbi:MAG: AMP-binding protein, partial [bacterium]|nr:AMP-binding protein [bacterium]